MPLTPLTPPPRRLAAAGRFVGTARGQRLCAHFGDVRRRLTERLAQDEEQRIVDQTVAVVRRRRRLGGRIGRGQALHRGRCPHYAQRDQQLFAVAPAEAERRAVGKVGHGLRVRRLGGQHGQRELAVLRVQEFGDQRVEGEQLRCVDGMEGRAAGGGGQLGAQRGGVESGEEVGAQFGLQQRARG